MPHSITPSKDDGASNGKMQMMPTARDSPGTSQRGDEDDDDDDHHRRLSTLSRGSGGGGGGGGGQSDMEAWRAKRPNRETWSKKTDFLLSIIGFAVDLANVWRFPYLCYRNGGGAFLIPYFSMLLFGAMPLFFMELVLGQFHREGSISVWKISPIFKGIGVAECLISLYVSFYYNVIIAWALYYLIASFSSTLPWTQCGQSWNTAFCFDSRNLSQNASAISRNDSVSSAAEYFERGVLQLHKSGGVDDLGPPNGMLVLCLAGVYIFLYFSVWKGVKSSGKVVWVTATMPYLVLTVLLIRGLLLPGAGTGITYFLTPKLDRLGDPQVWIDAAVQIFYSVGAGFGTHIAYASYNAYTNNCYRDCIVTVIVNSATSIFSGIVIFSYLGFMAVRQDVDIDKVVAEGPGLVFVVYPEAIGVLPGSVGWSVIFFIMLMTLGLDSAMGGMEAVLTGIKDQFSGVINRYRYGREILTGVVCAFSFLVALQNVTYGGMFMLNLWDHFAAGTAILCAVFFQAVAVSWFYGMEQFCDDIQHMLGFKPGLYWRICWKFISPLFIFVIIVSSLVSFTPLSYGTYTFGVYHYPSWAYVLGWAIAASSMLAIPAMAIYKLASTPGNLKRRIALCISPEWEHSAIEQGEPVSRFQARHWLAL